MQKLHKVIEKSLSRKVAYKNINYPKEYPQIEPLRRCPDISKIRKELNFKNKVSLMSSVKRFLFGLVNITNLLIFKFTIDFDKYSTFVFFLIISKLILFILFEYFIILAIFKLFLLV